jgi:hypothetical protein
MGLAILLAAPAAAGSSTEHRFFERGRIAAASGGECTRAPDSPRVTCTETSVDVFKGTRGGTNPDSRFRGEQVCVSRHKSTVNERTGRVLRETREQGCARNRRSLDVDFGERLSWASVAGTIKLQRERCAPYSAEPVCERDERLVALDLYWDGRGPILERFIYVRETLENCEWTISGTERRRQATIDGTIGTKSVDLGGELIKRDLQQTQVCT